MPTNKEVEERALEVAMHLLEKIEHSNVASAAADWAEAYAWVRYPSAPHGGSTDVNVSK